MCAAYIEKKVQLFGKSLDSPKVYIEEKGSQVIDANLGNALVEFGNRYN